MDLLFLFMVHTYWAFLTGLFFLTGAFISRIYVTGPSGMDVCAPVPGGKCLAERTTRFVAVIAAGTFAANGVHIALHAAVMTETPLREIADVLPVFLQKTKYGRFLILRTLLLAMLAVVAFIMLRKGEHRKEIRAGAAIAILLIATLSMSGHQGAKGYLTLPFVLDLLHAVAVAFWIGSLFFIRLCFALYGKESAEESSRIFAAGVLRFSGLATVSVVIAGVTGIGLAVANIDHPRALAETRYGMVLSLKTILAGALLLLGGVNKYLMLPQLSGSGAGTGAVSPLRRLLSLVSAEVVIGLLILLVTGLLTHLSPEE